MFCVYFVNSHVLIKYHCNFKHGAFIHSYSCRMAIIIHINMVILLTNGTEMFERKDEMYVCAQTHAHTTHAHTHTHARTHAHMHTCTHPHTKSIYKFNIYLFVINICTLFNDVYIWTCFNWITMSSNVLPTYYLLSYLK